MVTSPASANLNARIVHLVKQNWQTHTEPLLLSRLGNQDGGEISILTKQRATSVQDYLRNELSDQIRVIQHSSRSQLVGAVPITVDVEEEGGIDKLLEQTGKASMNTHSRFHPAFWAAFRKPLEESKHRYIRTSEPVLFQDSSQIERPLGHKEIDRKYIVGLEAEARRVHQMIQAWFADNGIEPAIYFSRASPGQLGHPECLLDELLNALDADQLERLTMPLDVVLKLRRQLR